MKRLIILLVIGTLTWFTNGCQDITVGYLLTESANYNPDTLVIKSKQSLDITAPTRQEVPNPEYEYYIEEEGMTPEELADWGIYPTMIIETGAGEDYLRAKWGQPWVSTPIEGVEGTAQIIVSIKNITSTSGDPDKLWEVLEVRGDGTFEIPLQHDVPAGRYVISLNFSNEGYSKDVNDCFTIIVK